MVIINDGEHHEKEGFRELVEKKLEINPGNAVGQLSKQEILDRHNQFDYE